MKVELPFLEVAEAVRQYLATADADVHFTASVDSSGHLKNLTAVVESDRTAKPETVSVGSATMKKKQ